MVMAIRLLAGLAVGFDVNPAPGVYVSIYLGIVELAFYNPEELEE
ncbi:hypothetical protein UFOVP729_35 [uncultured Caudovirales phage]|jgi:hypothetical protein|uniref:Uncharacterized protein n=1 Tax=uncultured Caudovirales phage TaxID=2100421 RepID=A0A6J5NPA8_9CAUD|nr:hypothetical protein UFOVP729_35 [uncultured Caudovirales phage]